MWSVGFEFESHTGFTTVVVTFFILNAIFWQILHNKRILKWSLFSILCLLTECKIFNWKSVCPIPPYNDITISLSWIHTHWYRPAVDSADFTDVAWHRLRHRHDAIRARDNIWINICRWCGHYVDTSPHGCHLKQKELICKLIVVHNLSVSRH